MISRVPGVTRRTLGMKSLCGIIIALAFVVPTGEGGGATKSPRKDGEVDPRTFTPTGRLKDRRRFRNYEVRIYQPRLGDGSLEVRRGGRRIYARVSEGGKFLIGELFESDTPKERIATGKDITGRGVPNLVVSEWTGGAHCCFSAHVFELGKHFRKIASLDAGHGKLDFQDLDGDGSLEAILHDWSFAYWPRSFAESPAPRVILRFRDGRYQVAPDLMRKPPPPAADLAAKARMVRESGKWDPNEPPPPQCLCSDARSDVRWQRRPGLGVLRHGVAARRPRQGRLPASPADPACEKSPLARGESHERPVIPHQHEARTSWPPARADRPQTAMPGGHRSRRASRRIFPRAEPTRSFLASQPPRLQA